MEERGEERERKKGELGRPRTRVRPTKAGGTKFKQVFTLGLMQVQSQNRRVSTSLSRGTWVVAGLTLLPVQG